MKYGWNFSIEDFIQFPLSKHWFKSGKYVPVSGKKNQYIQTESKYEEKGIQTEQNFDADTDCFNLNRKNSTCEVELNSIASNNEGTNVEKVLENENLQQYLRSELNVLLHNYQQLFKKLKEHQEILEKYKQKGLLSENYVVYHTELREEGYRDSNNFSNLEVVFQTPINNNEVIQPVPNNQLDQKISKEYLNDKTGQHRKSYDSTQSHTPKYIPVLYNLRRMEPYESKLCIHSSTSSDSQIVEKEEINITPLLRSIHSDIDTRSYIKKRKFTEPVEYVAVQQPYLSKTFDLQPVFSKTPYETDLQYIQNMNIIQIGFKNETPYLNRSPHDISARKKNFLYSTKKRESSDKLFHESSCKLSQSKKEPKDCSQKKESCYTLKICPSKFQEKRLRLNHCANENCGVCPPNKMHTSYAREQNCDEAFLNSESVSNMKENTAKCIHCEDIHLKDHIHTESDIQKKLVNEDKLEEIIEFLNDSELAKCGKVYVTRQVDAATKTETKKVFPKSSMHFSPKFCCRIISSPSNRKYSLIPCESYKGPTAATKKSIPIGKRTQKDSPSNGQSRESSVKVVTRKCISNLEKCNKYCSRVKMKKSDSKTVITIRPNKCFKK